MLYTNIQTNIVFGLTCPDALELFRLMFRNTLSSNDKSNDESIGSTVSAIYQPNLPAQLHILGGR